MGHEKVTHYKNEGVSYWITRIINTKIWTQ